MKDKAKRFFIEKKELLIFIGVVILVFTAVITVSSLAMRNNTHPAGKETDTSTTEPTQTNPIPSVDTDPILKEPVKFSLPVSGDYEIVRQFFDKSLSASELEKAVISSGSKIMTSSGVGYAMKDNSVFDVLAIYDGVVIDVVDDELTGAKVTVKHANDVISIYSSLSNLQVNKGDSISQGQAIGKASTSVDDISAGVHVFLEVKVNNDFVNPITVFGKKIEEISSTK